MERIEVMIENVRGEIEKTKREIAALKLEECRVKAEKKSPEVLNELREKKFELVEALKAYGFSEFYDLYKQNSEQLGGEWVCLKHKLRDTDGAQMSDLVDTISDRVKTVYRAKLDRIDQKAISARYRGEQRAVDSEQVLQDVKRFVLVDRAFERALKHCVLASQEYDTKRVEYRKFTKKLEELWERLGALGAMRMAEIEADYNRRHPRKEASSLFPEEREALLNGGVSGSAVIWLSGWRKR